MIFHYNDPPLYGESDYQRRGGKVYLIPPKRFLKVVPKLRIDDESRDNIDDLKRLIASGKKIDPLVLFVTDTKTQVVKGHDGRHRAVAAIELGIKTVPVIIIPVAL